MIPEDRVRLSKLHLTLALLLVAYSAILQAFIAFRLSLWSDEMDTIECVLAPWRGLHNFWWRVNQNVATPPGESLVLRLYNKIGLWEWIRNLSPELFWRLPYILVFVLCAVAGFFLAYRWIRSSFAGFVCLIFILCAPGTLFYATEARYYIWLCFFMTSALLLFMVFLEEKQKVGNLAWLSVTISAGVIFHIALAALGYLLIAYGVVKSALRIFYSREKVQACLPVFFLSVVPTVVYRIEQRHLWFLPKIKPLHLFAEISKLTPGFLGQYLVPFLPFPSLWLGGWLVAALIGATLMVVVLEGHRARYSRALQGMVLLATGVGCSLALLCAATTRGYPLLPRHFIFLIPVTICLLLYSIRYLVETLGARPSMIAHPWTHRTVSILLFLIAAVAINGELRQLAFASLVKVNYAFGRWKTGYALLPNKRPLVIVGTDPTLNNGDLGGFIGRMHERYLSELSPWYLSRFGLYDSQKKLAPAAQKTRILNHPEKFDFLLIGNPADLKPLHPGLPWTRWGCGAQDVGPITLCRLEN